MKSDSKKTTPFGLRNIYHKHPIYSLLLKHHAQFQSVFLEQNSDN